MLQDLIDKGYTHFILNMKLSAWWANGSVYTSEMKDAKPYKEGEAIKFAKSHTNPGGGLGAVPVRIADLVEVLAK